MKSILLFLSFIIVACLNLNAQVGINTINPKAGLLHIDSKGNNAETGAQTVNDDDVYVGSLGEVGIGTVDPLKLLHIKNSVDTPKSIIIEDGNQANRKLLGSDNDGNASWKFAGEIGISQGVLSSSGVNIDINSYSTTTNWLNTNAYIDLEPGMWMITASILLKVSNAPISNSTSVWVRTTFDSDSAYTGTTNEIYKMRYISGAVYTNCQTTLNGFLVIQNTSDSTKRYYFHVGWISPSTPIGGNPQLLNFASGAEPQNYLLAFKMKNN